MHQRRSREAVMHLRTALDNARRHGQQLLAGRALLGLGRLHAASTITDDGYIQPSGRVPEMRPSVAVGGGSR